MGDSRALQIRSFFFNPETAVYNAGYATNNTADMQYYLESQDISDIDVVIFALNHFSFNANWNKVSYPNHNDYIEPTSTVTNVVSQMAYIINNMNMTEIPVSDFLDMRLVGLNASINHNGMLNDGSYYYGEICEAADRGQSASERLANTLDRIENANDRFEHGEHADPDAILYLEEFLQYCKENDIYVICFAPPYAPTVNGAIKEKEDAYGYHYETLEVLPGIFDDYGFEFFDYTDVSFLGCTDDYFLDGFHGSDVVNLRMFINMIEQGSRLGEYCTLEDLQGYDTSRFSDIRILETWEQYNKISV